MTDFYKRIESTVYNFAFGDAWGYVTEFKDFGDIVKNQYQPPAVLKVSDDTQMGLYTMQALKNMVKFDVDFSKIDDIETINLIRRSFANSYIMFYYDNDNTRAPGTTCMSALDAYIFSAQRTGLEGSDHNNSLGCGTIMRTPWIGLLPLERSEMAALAVIQSQVTHGHPVSWIISAVLTLMINDFLHEENIVDEDISMFDHAVRVIDEIIAMELFVLSDFEMELNNVKTSLSRFADNWEAIAELIEEQNGNFVDVNKIFGEGWTADESLYNALGVCSLYDDSSEIYSGIRRLVYTDGDSDSIAAIGGSLYGAKYGSLAVSKEQIVNSLEPRYDGELSHMIDFICSQW